MSTLPFHSDTNSYFDLNLSLIWSKADYAATLTTVWAKPSGIFHSSMIELGLLGLLVLVLVVSITLLRRYAPASKDLSEL